MLLEALGMYEEKARSAKGKLPKVLMVVTGKGPDRDKYMKQVERLQAREGDKAGWEFVRCVSMWLEASDYPLLLGTSLPCNLMSHTLIRLRRFCGLGHLVTLKFIGN